MANWKYVSADDPLEIEAAQALRYRVFYDELRRHPLRRCCATGAISTASTTSPTIFLYSTGLWADGPEAVVGTYSLIRRDAAARKGGFYTASEYDIRTLETYPGEILELGRSCVAAEYRNRPTMQLLWRGIAAYVFHYDIALMFGCANLPGNDIDTIAPQLSYLAQHHAAPSLHVSVRALPSLYVDMNVLPADAIKPKEALMTLPPLIKGYLRLGGCVGDGAVIDRQFNTTDVCMIVGPTLSRTSTTSTINGKPGNTYREPASRRWSGRRVRAKVLAAGPPADGLSAPWDDGERPISPSAFGRRSG